MPTCSSMLAMAKETGTGVIFRMVLVWHIWAIYSVTSICKCTFTNDDLSKNT